LRYLNVLPSRLDILPSLCKRLTLAGLCHGCDQKLSMLRTWHLLQRLVRGAPGWGLRVAG
jgi:hypothetical protein